MSENPKGKMPTPTVNQSGPETSPSAFGSKPGEPLPKTMPRPSAKDSHKPAVATQPANPTHPQRPQSAPPPQAEVSNGPSGGPIQTINFKTELPHATFLLPSLGNLYSTPIPEGKVRLRAMGLREQMILNTPALHARDEAFPMIFRGCLTGLPEGMDVLNLFAEDKNAVLIALRQLSFGTKYEVSVTCPRRGCNKEFPHVVDLEADLKVNYLETQKLPEYPLVVPAHFLHCERFVKVRLQTWSDELNLVREREQALDEQNKVIDPTLQIRLQQQIVEIEGINKNHMMPFLEGMSAHDVSIVEQFIAKELFGIDTAISPPECPKCGHKFKANLTVNEGFFRATLPETETS